MYSFVFFLMTYVKNKICINQANDEVNWKFREKKMVELF